MRLLFAVISKSAELLRDDGLVAMLGAGICAIRVPSVPAAVNFSLVTGLRVESTECGIDHTFQVRQVIGADGLPLAGYEGPATPFNATVLEGTNFGSFTSIMTVAGMPMPAYGTYKFVFAVDGVDIGQTELDVLPLEQSHA